MAPRFFFGPARWLQPDSGLTAYERLVLAVLCQWTNKSTGECFPTIASVAAHASLSESSVHRAVAGLAKHGAIKIRQRRKPDGSPDSSVYFILGFDPTSAELEGGEVSHRHHRGVRNARGEVSHRHQNVLSANKNYRVAPEMPETNDLAKRPPRTAGDWQKLLEKPDR